MDAQGRDVEAEGAVGAQRGSLMLLVGVGLSIREDFLEEVCTRVGHGILGRGNIKCRRQQDKALGQVRVCERSRR